MKPFAVWPVVLPVFPVVLTVFECPVEAIGETYRTIFTVWLPGSDARFDPTVPVFEEYPKGTSERPVRIYVPLER